MLLKESTAQNQMLWTSQGFHSNLGFLCPNPNPNQNLSPNPNPYPNPNNNPNPNLNLNPWPFSELIVVCCFWCDEDGGMPY